MLQIFVTYLESNDSVLSIKNRIFYSEKSGWITTKLTVDNLVVTTYNGAGRGDRTLICKFGSLTILPLNYARIFTTLITSLYKLN